MAKAIANVNSLTDTFEQWLVTTNELANTMSLNAVTVDLTTAGANVSGNGVVKGYFGANVLSIGTIQGGGADLTTPSSNIALGASLNGAIGVKITANTFGVKTGIGGMNASYSAANLNITTNTVISGYLTVDGFAFSNAIDITVTSNSDIGVAGSYQVLTINTSVYSSAKLTVQARKGVNTEISEVILASNGSDVSISVYGTVMCPPTANIGSLSANISGTDLRVYYTSAADSTNLKILATLFR